MAYCAACNRGYEVTLCRDSDGEGPLFRRYAWVESDCCGADAYADEELTDKLTAADVDWPEPAGVD